MLVVYILYTVIFRELFKLQKWSKHFGYRITPSWGFTLTPKKSYFYSQSGVKIAIVEIDFHPFLL